MALIENKLIKYVLVLGILLGVIWFLGPFAPVKWKLIFSFFAIVSTVLYLEEIVQLDAIKLRRR